MSHEANARCLSCDTPVHAYCDGSGHVRLVECSVATDGEFAFVAGRLKELPIGAFVAQGCMRFHDHARHCKGSLRPEPSDVPTRPTGARKRRPYVGGE